jgi:hypothetical protein
MSYMAKCGLRRTCESDAHQGVGGARGVDRDRNAPQQLGMFHQMVKSPSCMQAPPTAQHHCRSRHRLCMCVAARVIQTTA